MAVKLTNLATAKLSASIDTDDTVIALETGKGSLFPSYSSGDWSPAVLVDAAGNRELVKITGRTGDSLTVERAQEGTLAQEWAADDRIDLRLTAAGWNELVAELEAKADATATAAALALKAPLASPTFTGTVTLPGDPASGLHAATKQYVDALAVNVGKRATVRVATTANITIATALNNGDSLDGVTLATGDLVLVKNQSSQADNGIYVVGVSPARDAQFDTYDEHAGALIIVQEGTTNADTSWLCTSNKGGTLGSSNLVFSSFMPNATTTTPGVAKIATVAKFRSGTDTADMLGVKETWDAAEPVNLGSSLSGNQTLDFGTFINAYGTLTGNTTFNNVSNLSPGKTGSITLIQSGGPWTLSLSATYFETNNNLGISLGTGRNELVFKHQENGKVFVSLTGKAVS